MRVGMRLLTGAHIFLYSVRNNTYLNAFYFDVGRRVHRHVATYTTLVTRVNDESLFIYLLFFISIWTVATRRYAIFVLF